MILKELQEYIQEKGVVTQKELTMEFGMSPDGADAMLAVLINKGRITRLVDTNKAQHITRVRYSVAKQDGLALTVTM